MKSNRPYEAHALFRLCVFRCETCICLDTNTFNYVIILNYNRYRCVSVCNVSEVRVL